MRRRWLMTRTCLVLALCLPVTACTHWRDSYLDDGVGTATQADIRAKFGAPHKASESSLSGESTWMYRFVIPDRETDPMIAVGQGITGLATWAASLLGKGGGDDGSHEKFHCARYEMQFDRYKFLKQWNREKC